ncbi:MAG: shikimate kinase [Ruminococcus sp.]|nr:shikimate kinase [Ruminococcus sp.]
MTVFLCGFMGCGKTTVGRIAAKKLGYGFCDSDELIVEREGMSIPEIFAEKGEPYFRQAEAEVIKSLCGKNIIVACGGGAMLNPDTAAAAAKAGAVIFIDLDFEACYERISGDENRPIVISSTKEELEERFNARYDVYMKHSTMQIDGSGSPLSTAELIIDAVKMLK